MNLRLLLSSALACALLAGCAATDRLSVNQESAPVRAEAADDVPEAVTEEAREPEETPEVSDAEEVIAPAEPVRVPPKAFRIAQVLDGTRALAQSCCSPESENCRGSLVLLKFPVGTVMYEGLRIRTHSPVPRGTWAYMTADGRQKTVPVLELRP